MYACACACACACAVHVHVHVHVQCMRCGICSTQSIKFTRDDRAVVCSSAARSCGACSPEAAWRRARPTPRVAGRAARWCGTPGRRGQVPNAAHRQYTARGCHRHPHRGSGVQPRWRKVVGPRVRLHSSTADNTNHLPAPVRKSGK